MKCLDTVLVISLINHSKIWRRKECDIQSALSVSNCCSKKCQRLTKGKGKTEIKKKGIISENSQLKGRIRNIKGNIEVKIAHSESSKFQAKTLIFLSEDWD